MNKLLALCLGFGLTLSEARALANDDAVYFSTGSYEVKQAALAKIVKKAGAGATFHLKGSTDPRGTEEANHRLRIARANAVKEALVALGVSDSNIDIQPGDEAAADGSSDNWKLRRVSIDFDKGATAAATPTETEKPVAEKPVKGKKGKAATASSEPATQEPEATPAEKPASKPAVVAMNDHATRPSSTGSSGSLKPEHGATETNPSEATASNGKKLEPLRLIYWKSLNHALWIVAKQKGFFAEEGFDAELVETDEDARDIAKKVNSVSSGVQTTGALEHGQKKFAAGAVCGFATHEAMAHGDPIVDIGSMVMIPETLLMKKETAAAIDKDMKAFKGLKIGDTVYGSGTHDFKYNNVLRVQLERVGLHDNQDFNIVEYKDLNKEYEALATGKLDVAKVFPPSDVEFTKAHPEFVRVPFAKFFPYLPCCRQVITRSQLKNNRTKYVRMLRATIRAHEFTIEHPREAAEIIGKWLKIPASIVRSSIMSAYVTLTPDPMRKGVELYQRTNDKYTGTKTSVAEYIDTSLYRDALVSLAQENKDAGATGYYNTMLARFKANN